MDALTFNGILDHRNWKFHSALICFSLIIPAILIVFTPEKFKSGDYFDLFILLFIQLEVFIMIARKIFRKLKTGISRIDLTRMMMSRFLIFMVFCFITALLINIIFIFITNLAQGNDPVNHISIFFRNGIRPWTRSTLGGLMFGAAVFIFVQWQDSLKREQKLREENLIFQNETLKNQINPHFLFNSLNTLSSLIVSSPDLAERFVIKLSHIYRYITENSKNDSVPLENELDFIREYFFLHKIRDDGKIELKISVPDAIRYNILPVSLQILVENAIKHNMATREAPLIIKITLDENTVIVSNNLQKMAASLKSTGTGLKNLSERIKLLTGKDLLISQSDKEYVVKIPLLK